jgi:uncharacterized membrane protein YcaP (DUF421 family)
MESVLKGIVVYVVVFMLFRIAGKRTLKDSTTFDLVLLLIISEAVSGSLVGQDYSVTNGLLIVITLIMTDVGFSIIKARFERAERFIDGVPLVLISNGKLVEDHMRIARVDKGDILGAAREMHGISSLEQIKYAILENNGTITIIPNKGN